MLTKRKRSGSGRTLPSASRRRKTSHWRWWWTTHHSNKRRHTCIEKKLTISQTAFNLQIYLIDLYQQDCVSRCEFSLIPCVSRDAGHRPWRAGGRVGRRSYVAEARQQILAWALSRYRDWSTLGQGRLRDAAKLVTWDGKLDVDHSKVS